MQSLGIATVPTAKGLKAIRMASFLVIQDETPVHCWYSADLITSGPGSVTSALLQKAEQVVTQDKTLKAESLPRNYSAQAAEIVALTEACNLAEGKVVTIYTDS